MSDLFDVHSTVKQTECDEFATRLLNEPVSSVPWQGYYSYTVSSRDASTIIQFRAAQSPLIQDIVKLAHETHPLYAPSTTFVGLLPGTDVSIWRMNKMSGVGFAMTASDPDLKQKLPVTVTDMAKFFAEAWHNPQVPSEEDHTSVGTEWRAKLAKLKIVLPESLQGYITLSEEAIDGILQMLPWVLTHADLSDMNILSNPETGSITGVVDWADAAVLPFGLALWGLESILGRDGESGWTWYEDNSNVSRAAFRDTFTSLIGEAARDKAHLIEKARVLGLLLRYGFTWEDGEMVPAKETSLLAEYLPLVLFELQSDHI